jgi:hypothetical protein
LKLIRCPRSLAPTPRRFTFYVAEPLSSILDAIGIHMHSLKVAGRIILFLFGLQMLFYAECGGPNNGI